jgi:phosphoribosyl-ATP pyrophosphohydrolase/phosphoribosyl-AMP cyclohydrolase
MTDRQIREPSDLDDLRFDQNGLIPVVAQESRTGEVLMVAYGTRESLERTLSSGQMHYWSRSRNELWRKGVTSGNVQDVTSLHADCDGDAVLARVEQTGPACHTDERTCFGDGAAPDDVFTSLWATLEARQRERPAGSYTVRLLEDENYRVKKLGEESAELILALSRAAPEQISEEAADLLYHVLVAILAGGTSLDDLRAELKRRRR